jgi:serine/threonine-protein kinase
VRAREGLVATIDGPMKRVPPIPGSGEGRFSSTDRDRSGAGSVPAKRCDLERLWTVPYGTIPVDPEVPELPPTLAMASSFLPGRFQVLEELSRTDDEILLRARDELLHREVWISRPAQETRASEDRAELARSLRQARALARVQHRGVIRLLDVLETEIGPVLVMEPAAGELLSDMLTRKGRLAPKETRDLAVSVCSALEAVHAAGVVHRGISSSSILLRSDGSPCLVGFVFAKFHGTGQSVFGTTFAYAGQKPLGPGEIAPPAPPYPAPEQILGQPADARSDLFGLGWVLYECLTGAGPYPADLDPDHWNAPTDPRRSAPGVAKCFAETILKCLSPSPAKRFASAREVREAIEREPAASAEHAPDRTARPATKKVAVVAGLALLLLGGGVWWALRAGGAGAAAAEETRGLGAPRTNRNGTSHSDRYEHSRALLIGIGEAYAKHGFPVLPNAERDVATIGERLSTIATTEERWDVELLQGAKATHDGILARLRAIADAAQTNDKVFIYYAGHGIGHDVSERSGWIIPADGLTEDQDPSRKTWVRFDEFGHLFDESQAKHVLVAMDCCYGGRLVASRAGAAAKYSRRLVAEPAKVILSSGRPHEQVSDGVRGENSPFARAFLDVLSRTDIDAVTTSDLYASIERRFVEDDVSHLPVRGTPPGAPLSGEVVFFLK